jgi:signal transduction histidine kinase
MPLIGGLGIAALFYAAAEYERLTGWKWALASLAITGTIEGLFPLSFIFVLPAQFGLFCAMIYANVRNKAALEVERASRRETDQRVRQERVSRARQEAEVNTDWKAREAERATAAEAALRERQERVRLAREAREREERQKGSAE